MFQVLTLLFLISAARLEAYFYLHCIEKAIEVQKDESPAKGRPARNSGRRAAPL